MVRKNVKTVIEILMVISALIISEKIFVLLVYAIAAVLHEAGHLLAARMLKIKIQRIYFDFSGMRMEIDNNVRSYSSEIVLALAGPLANALLAMIALFSLLSVNKIQDVISATESFLMNGAPTKTGVVGFFVFSSCVQAVINITPIKSFDGGRVLYCIVAKIFNDEIARVTLSVISGIFAFVLWTVSLYLMIRISSGLGIFVFSLSIFSLMAADSKIFEDKGK